MVERHRDMPALDEINCLREILEARIDAMDKAFDIFTGDIKRIPTELDTRLATLKELHEEKFKGIADMFKERTMLRSAFFDAANAAVTAALAATKEATQKSEATFTREIDGLKSLFNKSIASSDEKIGDLKDRITSIEGKNTGMGTIIFGGISVVMMMIALASATIAFGRGGGSNDELVRRGSIAAQTVPAQPVR